MRNQKNSELYELFLKNYYSLQFSPAVDAVVKEAKKNPKRIQREIRKAMDTPGVGTKSQQALQLQREQNKQERKARSRDAKQAEAQRRFELKQQKRKNKHRGRWCPQRLFQRHITEKKKRKIEIWFLRQRD